MATYSPKLDHGLNIPRIKQVKASQPLVWLKDGWRDLLEHPGPSLTYGAAVTLLGGIILLVGMSSPVFMLTATSGYLLIAPLLAAGIYELTRQREQGKAHPTMMDSLRGLRGDASSVIYYGIVLALSFLVWERVATILFALSYSGQISNIEMFVDKVLFSLEFMWVLVAWLVAGGLLASLVFAVSMVGIPMVVDRKVDIVTAMVTSVKAARANVPAMVVWAALVVGLSLVGWLTAMIGLLFIMPLLGHATWCAYRDLVEH